MSLGPDGHPIPDQQGVVVGNIGPIHAKDLRVAGNQGQAQARGVALRLPQFVRPPRLMVGTEARGPDGPIANTGNPDPTTVEVTPETLEQAAHAAARVCAMLGDLPLTESSVDVMNMALAVLHHANKGNK